MVQNTERLGPHALHTDAPSGHVQSLRAWAPEIMQKLWVGFVSRQ